MAQRTSQGVKDGGSALPSGTAQPALPRAEALRRCNPDQRAPSPALAKEDVLYATRPKPPAQLIRATRSQVDVICPNGLRTWEEIQEAIRLIPGPVVPLIPAHLSPYPSLQAQQDAGAAAAWFPALTTMAGLQANWDFLSDFQQRGTLALDALRAQAAQSPWGVASNGRILDEPRLRSMEEMYLLAGRRCPGLSADLCP